MAQQAYPVESPGHATTREWTCSRPAKGTNLGCPAWTRCDEPTKGVHPVRVFVRNYQKDWVEVLHCAEWHGRSKVKGMDYLKRIQPPPKEVPSYIVEKVDGQPKRRLVMSAAPEEALRGREGSGYAFHGQKGKSFGVLAKMFPGEPRPLLPGDDSGPLDLEGSAVQVDSGPAQPAGPPRPVDVSRTRLAEKLPK